MEEIEYRAVPGYEGYRVGSDGTVWRFRKGVWIECKLTLVVGKYGYRRLQVGLVAPGMPVIAAVHALVLTAFVGPRPPGLECLHRDGNSLNNRATNLRWGTHQENMDDRDRHGTTPRGETNGRAKLTDEKVLTIRARLDRGEKQATVAADLDVSRTTVYRVHSGRSWSHVGRSKFDPAPRGGEPEAAGGVGGRRKG
jgi:hypothetical protein